MSMVDTITHPWKNPVDYAKLAFWVVIFAIVAFALYDGMRVIASYVKGAV